MKGCFIRVSSDRKTGGFIAKTLKLCRAVYEFDFLNRIVVRFHRVEKVFSDTMQPLINKRRQGNRSDSRTKVR